MIEHRYFNDCVGCHAEKGCLYSACPYYDDVHLICDVCSDEAEELYIYGSEQLCGDCLHKTLERIDFDNYKRYE